MNEYASEVLSGQQRWAVVHGDCTEEMRWPPDGSIDHVITDPPYSDHVHAKHRRGGSLPDAGGGRKKAQFSRAQDLGFAALAPETMLNCALNFSRLCKRWVLIFSNAEINNDWRLSLEDAGLEHVRVGAWVKLGATPQFTGDRPASGFEAIEIAHRKGRKRWNGGGGHGIWSVPIEMNRGGNNARLHTTQKPLPLMLALVEQFTDPDELVLDPFCGSGTTGLACLMLGRRFIGIERDETWAATARERLAAWENGTTLRASRAGQQTLFGGGSE